mmetsp:Transcript_16686/g.17376  ORF Transcript_16686/g.17376 Transcript_16686/m.17376 type:complete len:134 (-) Transcript_16686:27-428(-)
METKKTVLTLYRRMLYTLMEVFEGDYETFHKMRIGIRREIEKNSGDMDEKSIRQKILDLEEARTVMTSSIMQGKLQDGDFYKYKARPDLFMGTNTPVKDNVDLEKEMEMDLDMDKEINDNKKGDNIEKDKYQV